LPKLRINLGKGDDAATVTTVDVDKSKYPNRNMRRRSISNNNKKARIHHKKKNRRKSRNDSSDESTDVEYSSSDNESE